MRLLYFPHNSRLRDDQLDKDGQVVRGHPVVGRAADDADRAAIDPRHVLAAQSEDVVDADPDGRRRLRRKRGLVEPRPLRLPQVLPPLVLGDDRVARPRRKRRSVEVAAQRASQTRTPSNPRPTHPPT
eukprot:CAMPEP_0176315416 /NCGR_PEP_ID=MMETSP0121_2-20121125/68192_1 /TAXON_ID=160619 /ORGANISM="Kryptoperidinium foliaceum, Strain CCMP 1326" /LENGTH=127 /DNA_ID=CAMNT_0017657567 /DNA_START=3 /DNA_END=386 /DNA_ORIENTATION=-